MAKQNIVITANANNVTVTGWNVKTGEYNIQNCMVVLEDIDDLTEDIQLYKWFAVFKYDKKEYESEIIFDVNADGTIDYTKGRFDLPVFDKPGYVSVGVYGYELRVDEIESEKLKENISKEDYDNYNKKVYTGYVNNTFVRSFDFTQGCKEANPTFFESVLDTTKTGCALSGKYTITLKDVNATWTTFTPYVTYTYTPLNPDTGEFEMSLRYSPEMELCEVERGSTTTQPIPSPGTYMRLKQMIEEIKGQGFVTQAQFDALKALVEEMDDELVYGLAEVLELSKGEDGKYHTTYKELYTIVDNYFNQSGVFGRQGGEHIEEIRKLLTFIPNRGTTNQMLYKKSNEDYDLEWRNHPIPEGGTQGQRLVKGEGGDYSLEWANEPVPVGGTAGQVLHKKSNTDYDLEWTTLPQSKDYDNYIVTRSDSTTDKKFSDIVNAYQNSRSIIFREVDESGNQSDYKMIYFYNINPSTATANDYFLFEKTIVETTEGTTSPAGIRVYQKKLRCIEPDGTGEVTDLEYYVQNKTGLDFDGGSVYRTGTEGNFTYYLKLTKGGLDVPGFTPIELEWYASGSGGGVYFKSAKVYKNTGDSKYYIQYYKDVEGTIPQTEIAHTDLDLITVKPLTTGQLDSIKSKFK